MRNLALSMLLVVMGSLLAIAADQEYTGTWASSQTDASGTIHMLLKQEPVVSFTLGGEDVKPKIVRSKIDGDSFEIEYEFETQGYKLKSLVKGTVKDQKLTGTYETSADGNQIDNGKVEGTAAKS